VDDSKGGGGAGGGSADSGSADGCGGIDEHGGAGAGLSAPAPASEADPEITDSDLETSRSATIERGGDDTIDVGVSDRSGLPAAAVARGPVTATATASASEPTPWPTPLLAVTSST
jgi:hypothetical protein